MLALTSCWLAAVLAAVPLASGKPADWTLHYSSQVARPVWVSASPESSIPRFPVPVAASRRQDGANNLQSDAPVQVAPGDKVSLVVNSRNPLEPQRFVDVSTLLMELQKLPPASDGSYHVFLAPPNYPIVNGGQKFDVTYVGAPQRDPARDVRNNPHPPLFVAPLDYSVPKGYGRIQVPTKNVKFALSPGGPAQLVQQPQQPAQFRPAPVAPPQPAPPRPVQQSFVQPQQFLQPQQFQQQPVQQPFPAPVQFQQRPVQPVPAFQPVQPVQQVQQVQVKQPAPLEPSLPVPMAFRPAHQQHVAPVVQQTPSLVEESRVQPAPPQALEEIPAPDLTVRPQEPVVLAAEKPEFLNVPAQTEAPVSTEAPVATTEAAPQLKVEVVAPVEDVPVVPVAAPEADTEAPFVPPPSQAPTTEATTTPEPTRPAKKTRPIAQVQTIDGTPQWPDFQTVRQRQQQNRQQINRQRPTGNTFVPPNPASFSREPSVDPSDFADFSFGQKLRPKIKTNALVSPPAPVAAVVVSESSLDVDPPVIERDEPFQTLESQNAASSRGRIRFSRPQEVNALPATTEAPVARQTESVRSPGRNRFRITTTTTPAPTTVAQTEPTTPARGDAQPEEEEEEEEEAEVKPTETPAEEASEDEEEEEEEKVEPVKEEAKPWNPRLSLAAQRQRESAETTTAAPAKPNRGRGTITFANSRLSAQRPEQINRPVVIRPAAPRVRPATPGSRIQRPLAPQPVVREEEDLVVPVAVGFGVKDGAAVNNAPQQSLLPVGRRVPEQRPNPVQTIRVGPPRIQPTTEKVVIVEEAPEEEFEPEVEDEEVFDEEEPEADQEEIVDEEVEDEVEDVVSNLAESSQVTSAPEAVEDAPVEPQVEEEVQEDEVEEEPEKEAAVEEEAKEEQPETPVTEAATTTVAATTPVAATTTVAATTVAATTVAPSTTEAAAEEEEEEPEATPTETTLVKPIEETPVELSVANNVDEDAEAAPQAETADERQVLGVSTATEVSLMYELCYRGRCVRVHE